MKRIPDPNAKPAVDVKAWDLNSVETKKSNQYDSGFWVEKPAMATFTGLGTDRLAKVSVQTGDMTERPSTCMVVAAPDGQGLYFIPGVDHAQAIEVKYIDGRAQMNLVKVFTLLDKLVPANSREFYPLNWPDHPVRFEGNEYQALYMQIEKTASKKVKTKKRVRRPAKSLVTTAAADQAE